MTSLISAEEIQRSFERQFVKGDGGMIKEWLRELEARIAKLEEKDQ